MLKRLFVYPIFLSFFALTSITFGSDTNVCNSITQSIIPLLKEIEDTPPEKYQENYSLKINNLLAQKAQKIRVVTYNLLFNLFDDQLKDSTYSWANRLPHIVQTIENIKPDILCVQETYPSQLQDLQKSLEGSFLHFVGSSKIGELNAIFYNKERFELDLNHYQDRGINLSSASLEMPINPKDDALVATIPDFLPPDLEPGKQLTLVHLHDKLTHKQFVVMNTHLTFYRINSREAQAHFISELVQKLHTLDKIVILAGDFNTFPNRPDKPSFRFYDGGYICQIFQTVLKDTKEAALLGHVGPLASSIRDFLYRGNKPFYDTESPEVILDHIYVSPTVPVIINAIEPSLVDGRFPSDHMPVIADILLP